MHRAWRLINGMLTVHNTDNHDTLLGIDGEVEGTRNVPRITTI